MSSLKTKHTFMTIMAYILKPCITFYTLMVSLSSTTTPASFLSLTDCLMLLPQELHGQTRAQSL